jgi:antirestriction protein ArdC
MKKSEKQTIRERMQPAINKIRKMTEEQKMDLVIKYGIHNTEGHRLSGFNHALIFAQWLDEETTPTIVGGYKQWQKQGRQVRKGSHAVFIAVPSQKKQAEETPEDEEDIFFLYKPVFDLSQTKAKREEEEQQDEVKKVS